jgi:hypothetical protein
MAAKIKPRAVVTRAGRDEAYEKPSHFTSTDPLIGWFNLAKPSRTRQQKRGWQRGARR